MNIHQSRTVFEYFCKVADEDLKYPEAFLKYAEMITDLLIEDSKSIWARTLFDSHIELISLLRFQTTDNSERFLVRRNAIILMGWCMSVTNYPSSLKFLPHCLESSSEYDLMSSQERILLQRIWSEIFKWWHAWATYVTVSDKQDWLNRNRSDFLLDLRSQFKKEVDHFITAVRDDLESLKW